MFDELFMDPLFQAACLVIAFAGLGVVAAYVARLLARPRRGK